MKFSTEGYRQARWMIGSVILMFWFFAFILIKDSFKTREDFQVITGIVIEEGNKSIVRKVNNHTYVYYFRLSSREQPFALMTSKDWIPIDDKSFKSLNIGDKLTVTYEENSATNSYPVNLQVKEVIRNDEVLFDRIPTGYFWNGRMRVGFGSFLVGLIPLTILIFLERKYRHYKRLAT
jgi:hypothetical protein